MDSVRSQMDAMTLKYDDMYVHRQQMEQQMDPSARLAALLLAGHYVATS